MWEAACCGDFSRTALRSGVCVAIRRSWKGAWRRAPAWCRATCSLDFWRVECYEPNRRLRLFAEMKLPGRAWLEFSAEAEGASTLLRQVAEFEPRGFSGLLYWYLLWPVHKVMFRGMTSRIAAVVLLEGRRGSEGTRSAVLDADKVTT